MKHRRVKCKGNAAAQRKNTGVQCKRSGVQCTAGCIGVQCTGRAAYNVEGDKVEPEAHVLPPRPTHTVSRVSNANAAACEGAKSYTEREARRERGERGRANPRMMPEKMPAAESETKKHAWMGRTEMTNVTTCSCSHPDCHVSGCEEVARGAPWLTNLVAEHASPLARVQRKHDAARAGGRTVRRQENADRRPYETEERTHVRKSEDQRSKRGARTRAGA